MGKKEDTGNRELVLLCSVYRMVRTNEMRVMNEMGSGYGKMRGFQLVLCLLLGQNCMGR